MTVCVVKVSVRVVKVSVRGRIENVYPRKKKCNRGGGGGGRCV